MAGSLIWYRSNPASIPTSAYLKSKCKTKLPLVQNAQVSVHKKGPRPAGGVLDTVLNIGRYTGISAEISVFYSKRYDKCKILSDIVLDRYGPIYRHVADISADTQDENIRYIVT